MSVSGPCSCACSNEVTQCRPTRSLEKLSNLTCFQIESIYIHEAHLLCDASRPIVYRAYEKKLPIHVFSPLGPILSMLYSYTIMSA